MRDLYNEIAERTIGSLAPDSEVRKWFLMSLCWNAAIRCASARVQLDLLAPEISVANKKAERSGIEGDVANLERLRSREAYLESTESDNGHALSIWFRENPIDLEQVINLLGTPKDKAIELNMPGWKDMVELMGGIDLISDLVLEDQIKKQDLSTAYANENHNSLINMLKSYAGMFEDSITEGVAAWAANKLSEKAYQYRVSSQKSAFFNVQRAEGLKAKGKLREAMEAQSSATGLALDFKVLAKIDDEYILDVQNSVNSWYEAQAEAREQAQSSKIDHGVRSDSRTV